MKKGIRLDNTDLISLVLITCLCISKIASFSEYTSIVTDEVQYKEIILGLKEPHLFNPAYYKIYEIVKYAKAGWYLGIRLLNLLFIYTSAEAIRRICMMYKIQGIRKVIVYITLICTGLTTYMLNAMPECMYFAAIYWTIYILLKTKETSTRNSIIINTMCGGLSLIKPHGILIYPIILLTYMKKGNKQNALSLVKQLIISTIVFVIVRWGIGWLITGPIAYGIFGGAYESLGNKDILASLDETIFIMFRHTVAWALVVPFLASWIYVAGKGTTKKLINKNESDIQLLTIGTIITSIIVYSMFTSSVNTIENMQVDRLHLRYYSFITPIITISTLVIIPKIKCIANKWELLAVNTIAAVIILVIGLCYDNILNIKGNWIDSPMIIISDNIQTFTMLMIIAISLIMIASWRGSFMLPMYYTAVFLILSETKQWIVSETIMADSRQASEAYKYLELKTDKEDIDILIKGKNQLDNYNTKKEMIDCIKLVMLQTSRPFKEMCLKDIKLSKNRYMLTYSHVDYGEFLDKYCTIARLNNLSPYEKELQILKNYNWDNISYKNTKSEDLIMIGYNNAEHWGRWGKYKKTMIITKELLNGNAQIRFEARSLQNSQIKIGEKIINIDQTWKPVVYDLKNANCIDKIEITYNEKPIHTEGRTLTYAIKEIEIVNKNE